MPLPLTWTPPRDAQIHRLRAEGASWDEIAADLRISRWAAIDRARRLGACKSPASEIKITQDFGREPLPAGHRISWDALVAGTMLEGTRYPWPPLRFDI